MSKKKKSADRGPVEFKVVIDVRPAPLTLDEAFEDVFEASRRLRQVIKSTVEQDCNRALKKAILAKKMVNELGSSFLPPARCRVVTKH